MQLDLDLPALRQWQIRAAEAEQQSSLAQQREAAFQHDLQAWTDRVAKLETELESAREAAEEAERSAGAEREAVARLQGRLKEVRAERKRAREECEELRLKRGVLKERLREEELGWREGEREREEALAAVEKLVEGLESMRLGKRGGEVMESAEDALETAEWAEDEGEASDAETEVLAETGEDAGEGDTETGTPPLRCKMVDGAERGEGTPAVTRSSEREWGKSGSSDGTKEGERLLEQNGGESVEPVECRSEDEKGGVDSRGELDASSVDEEAMSAGAIWDAAAEDGPEQDPMDGACEAGASSGNSLDLSIMASGPQPCVNVTTRAAPSPAPAAGRGAATPEEAPWMSCSPEKATVDLTSESSVGAYTSADWGSEEAAASVLALCNDSSASSLAYTGCLSLAGGGESALSVSMLEERSTVECRVRGWLEALETETEGWDEELKGGAGFKPKQDIPFCKDEDGRLGVGTPAHVLD